MSTYTRENLRAMALRMHSSGRYDVSDALEVFAETIGNQTAVTDDLIQKVCCGFDDYGYGYPRQVDVGYILTAALAKKPGWVTEDIRLLLEAMENDHGGDHTEADCRYCTAFNRVSAVLNGENV